LVAKVTFRILGPFEVLSEGARVPVTGPRVQAILALLLLEPGREVSMETLLDVVWGDEAPPTARTAMQVHISKLRKWLASAGFPDALVTSRASYELRIPPDSVDAFAFKRLVEEGGKLLGAGDNERAIEALERALSLWRGSPLTGIDLPGLAPGVLNELEDLHDRAMVLRFEAELAMGHHAEIVPDLGRARADRPLDERVAELAALALYRSGRQADALAELSALRHSLSEELGMEPGAAISELERKILGADPSLRPEEPQEALAKETRKTVTVVALRLPSGDPEDVRASTAAVADIFEGVVSSLGGWCPPASSGRLLAVFGVPAVHEEDAERAVKTADALSRLAQAMGVDTKLAVATGEVLVEVAGDEVQLLTHDPIEVADQLARKARAGEVLLGVATQRLTQTIAAVDPSPMLVLDDEDSPLVAYRLVDVAEARSTQRLRAPLVGRDHEMTRLSDAARRALEERRPTLLTVLGAAGVGKSRLVDSFVAGLGDRVEVAVGRCLPYGRDMGMWPVAQVVRSIAGVSETSGAGSAARRLNAFVADEPDGEILGEQLRALLGLTDRNPAPDETSWAIRRFLEVAATRRPLVVLLEDLHWADDSLLDLIGYASSTASDVPVVFVGTARGELIDRRPGWGTTGANAVTIRLEPLEPADADELLNRLLGTSELDLDARARIASVAEGNPLFLEETVAMLIDDGHLSEKEGRWEPAADLHDVPLPPTVKALLEARVDLLDVTERDVLEAAAIVGREFSDEDLEDLRPDEDAAGVTAALDALCRRDFLQLHRFTKPGSRWYAFRHMLLREVVYGAIPKEMRARDHERFGRGSIDRAGERLPEIQEIVGYHLETAYQLRSGIGRRDDPERAELGRLAATHLLAAGRRAYGRDDLSAAASLYGRALVCVAPGDPLRGEIARRRAATLFDLGDFDNALETMDEAIADAGRRGDETLRLHLELERMNAETYLGTKGANQARELAESAIEVLTGPEQIASRARAFRLLGEALFQQGRHEEANEAFLEGWRLAEEAGDERELAFRPQLVGLHGPAPLSTFIEQCERFIMESSRLRPETLVRLALAYALAGDDDLARVKIAEGLARADDIGGTFRVADARVHAGVAHLYMDDAPAALDELEGAVRDLSTLGETSVRSTAGAYLGEALHRLGRLDESYEAAMRSREVATADDQATQMGWRQVAAKVHADRGRMDEAVRLMDEAVAIADETDFVNMAAFVHLDAADVYLAAGLRARADEERSKALALFESKGAAPKVLARRSGVPSDR
jgi:DNA-binding SARP family transcriptional activator